MKRTKVFLTGGDGIGWAVDEDLRLTRDAISHIVDFVDLPEAEVVHSLWWWQLINIPEAVLAGKRVICHVPGEPFRYLEIPDHCRVMDLVGLWITRTSQARDELAGVGVESRLIPYLIDVNTFRPLGTGDARVEAIRRDWGIPSGSYLIGSFQRDTEGADLCSPKLVKGPDVMAEILASLHRGGAPIHAVLAGPRRHWIINRLSELGVPFTYVGKRFEGDDIEANKLPRSRINELYNLVDLCMVASRSEGGPHAIPEAAAAGCKVVSARVGMAPDVLEPECIFKSPADAVEIIRQDISERVLDPTVEIHSGRVLANHVPASAKALFEDVYANIEDVPVTGRLRTFSRPGTRVKPTNAADSDTVPRTAAERLTVGMWHTFFKPPYGGGNQFMMALRKALTQRNIDVRENEIRDGIDAYLLNSIHFDVDRFMEYSRRARINVIHRIDGPIHLIRGYDREKDELCYELNDRFASATVLQSAWVYQRITDMGYRPRNPVIIHNAVDPAIFNRNVRIPFDRTRKLRIISSSWSNNPRKGGPIYKWLEDHLDWNRYEYTFVGNVSEKLERIRHIDPVSSQELADLLRQHDVYIAASKNDPCSNALIEALSCGLPALYLNDGGHPELVGYGGLPFETAEEIPSQLEKIADNYEMFQNIITVPQLDDVAEKYLTIIRKAVQ